MGRDFSKNLGVHYNFVLFMGLSIAAMITASVVVVVVVGSISYIGLIVPNLVAMFRRQPLTALQNRRWRKAAVLKTRLTRMAQKIPARAGHRRAPGQLS